jgi:dephospho-CoA kinase
MAKKLIATQTSDEIRNAAATHVIINDGDLEDLRRKILDFIISKKWNS